MKMIKTISVYIMIFFLLSCNRSSREENAVFTTADGVQYVKLTPLTNEAGGQYQGYDIVDPGMNNMSAMIIQIPNGWKAQHTFTRIWNGSTPINQIYLKATSEDNQESVEILPYSPYYYADGPTARSLRETSRSMGLPQQYQPFELPPMEPLAYLEQYVLPNLQQHGISFQQTDEKNLGNQHQFKNTASKHAYVDGKLNDGRSIRVECGIISTSTNMNGELYYNWQALSAILISGHNLDGCYDILKHMRGTILFNPEWEQKNNRLVRKGNADNAAIAKQDYENVKNYREAINTIHQGITDDRNYSQDRNNESGRDVLGGEAKFENPDNGDRVRLDDNYKHYYTDGKGNYYGSNDPLNYKDMNWTEVNRLDTKDY